MEPITKIPIRNIWLLLLYASDMYRELYAEHRGIEESPDDIPDLIAEMLAARVETRLRRNLSYGYQSRYAELTRVRGRIDVLNTEAKQLLSRGRVACRFDEMTNDTARNRYIKAALLHLASLVSPGLARRCKNLAWDMTQLGVGNNKPTKKEVAGHRYGRHEIEDKGLVDLAHLAFDLKLPTQEVGSHQLVISDGNIAWLRRLFEKAVAGFYQVVLPNLGWVVSPGKRLNWQIEEKSERIDSILPAMQTDIHLEHPAKLKRVVVDTKFNQLLVPGYYREETVRSAYLYQIYAYLMSQNRLEEVNMQREGILLHPAVNEAIDEYVMIQKHVIRFKTVDLAVSGVRIREQLLCCL